MNGYDTQIFEMHSQPGGLCTSWERKDYKFDNCIHWLVGSKDEKAGNELWKELGALSDVKIINHDEFVRIIGENSKTLILN